MYMTISGEIYCAVHIMFMYLAAQSLSSHLYIVPGNILDRELDRKIDSNHNKLIPFISSDLKDLCNF